MPLDFSRSVFFFFFQFFCSSQAFFLYTPISIKLTSHEKKILLSQENARSTQHLSCTENYQFCVGRQNKIQLCSVTCYSASIWFTSANLKGPLSTVWRSTSENIANKANHMLRKSSYPHIKNLISDCKLDNASLELQRVRRLYALVSGFTKS